MLRKQIIIFGLMVFTCLPAQEIQEICDSMQAVAPGIRFAASDPERYEANEHFMKLLDEALRQDSRMRFTWPEMEGVSILSSPDQRCRIFTWFIPHLDGTYTYHGVVQSYNERQRRYLTHWLNDQSGKIQNPEQATLDPANWYGALYYEMISVGSSNTTYYTLLGWDGHDPLIRNKLIEVMTLRSNGTPVFGYPLFRNKYTRNRRIIFAYSARASMSLRYDKQAYTERIRQKGKGMVERRMIEDMIVFDRLMPMHPSMEGQYAFYVPETNVVDGMVFRNSRWHYFPNIDARNPPPPRKRKPAPRPTELQLLPGP